MGENALLGADSPGIVAREATTAPSVHDENEGDEGRDVVPCLRDPCTV